MLRRAAAHLVGALRPGAQSACQQTFRSGDAARAATSEAGAALCACSSLPPQDAHSYSKLNEGLGLGQQTHSQSSSPGPCWLRHGAVHKHQLPVSVRCLHNSFPSRSSADASSHGATLDQPDQPAASTSQPAQALGRIVPKDMAIVFTCGKCSTRAIKSFSKQSYEKGLVMVRCPGCQKYHLIADHLGWFGDKGWTVEALAAEKGERVKVVRAGSERDGGGPGSTGASALSAADLTAEDWAGWSSVQRLLQVSEGSQQAAASRSGQAGAREAEGAAGGEGGGDPGVVSVQAEDVERWRRVRQATGKEGKAKGSEA